MAVLDGKQGPEFDHLGVFLFSDDSSRFAYRTVKNGKFKMVLNGNQGPEYDEIGFYSFSPDSSHFAYMAIKNGNSKIVIDGKEGKTYSSVSIPVFSPDSAHLAYKAWDLKGARKEWHIVLDGKEQQGFDAVGRPFFSPDGRHVIYTASSNTKWFLVVDGKAGTQTFFGFVKREPLVFDSPNRFHGLAIRMPEREYFRVEVEIPEGSK